MEPYLARDFSKALFAKPMFHVFRQYTTFSLSAKGTISVHPVSCEEAIRERKNAEEQFYNFCALAQPIEPMDCLFIMNERERLFQAVESARILEKTLFGLK